MAAMDTVQTRISPEIKKQAEALFNQIGLNLTDAIRMFLYQSIKEKGLPFWPSLLSEPSKPQQAISIREAARQFRELGVEFGDGVEYQRRIRAEWD